MTEENKLFKSLKIDPEIKAKNKTIFQICVGILFLLVILNSLFGYWLIVGLSLVAIIFGYMVWKKPILNGVQNNLNKYEHTKTYKLTKDDLKAGFGFNDHTITNLKIDKKTKNILVEVKNEN